MKEVPWFFVYVLLAVALGYLLYFRINHPDATEFRCFLETWPVTLVAFGCGGLVMWKYHYF